MAPEAGASDEWLSIGEAAALLNTNRPYVMMLCTHGRLGEVDSGEPLRRVKASAVRTYLGELSQHRETFGSLQQSALDAGLYEIPEEAFGGFVRDK